MQTILIVDDTPANVYSLDNILTDDFNLKAALNGEKALSIAKSENPPDLILLDIMMPGIDGFEVCRQLKANNSTADIPVIFLSSSDDDVSMVKAFDLGAADYITKPFSPSIVKARIKTQLTIANHSKELEAQVRSRTVDLLAAQHRIVKLLGMAAEYRLSESGLNGARVSAYARVLAEAEGLDPQTVELIADSTPLHDLGEISIPDFILLKTGPLNENELANIRNHPVLGAQIIGDDPSPILKLAHEIALTHHERWDGSGYPHGLSEEDIPLSGRIAAIADVYDALTSHRPYRDTWSNHDAMEYISTNKGILFDPKLTESFSRNYDQILKFQSLYADID